MVWDIFAVMVGCFILTAMVLKWPVGIAMMSTTLIALVYSGQWTDWPHLIEGSMAYLDAMLVIATAMIFMRSLIATGRLQAVSDAIVRRFGNRPWVLLPLLMLLVMFPGMLTGSSTAAVLTSGVLVAPVLLSLGLDKARVAAIVAMGSILGMVAPPVNLPVMIIGSGVDMPYTGFTIPLLLLTMPLAWVIVYLLGYPVLRKRSAVTQAAVKSAAVHEEEPEHEQPDAIGAVTKTVSLVNALIPIVIIVAWMIADRVWIGVLPAIGLPLLFILGAALSFAMSGKGPWLRETLAAIKQSLPVLSILAGVGMFIQVMTLLGVRGTLVVSLLSLPPVLQYLGMGLGIPAFGAISAYGAASVLGVPFLLALLGKNEIIVGAALSLLTGVADLTPPTALAGIFAAQAVGLKSYGSVMRMCIIPAIITTIVALVTIAWIA
ncbi:MAG: TRAP transporter large permease subunit [Limnochordia bacterium]